MREYVAGCPRRQSLVDLFAGEWSSALPVDLGVEAGAAPLYDDDRLRWLVEQVGPLDGMRVLELGPLEGGHTAMLLDAGAAEVVAVEANVRAYLRCLVAHQLTGHAGATFLLGEVAAYAEAAAEAWDGDGPAFDLVVASGVLYHLLDPATLLAHLGRLSDRVFVWTHYVDREVLQRHDPSRLLERLPTSTEHVLRDGTTITYHQHDYALEAIQASFCGGAADASAWMELDGLRAGLRAAGLTEQVDGFHEPDHPSGPAIAILATRPEPRAADRTRPAPTYGLGQEPAAPQVHAVPRGAEHAALVAERDRLRDEVERHRQRADALEALLQRRDVRGVVRRTIYPWREG